LVPKVYLFVKTWNLFLCVFNVFFHVKYRLCRCNFYLHIYHNGSHLSQITTLQLLGKWKNTSVDEKLNLNILFKKESIYNSTDFACSVMFFSKIRKYAKIELTDNVSANVFNSTTEPFQAVVCENILHYIIMRYFFAKIKLNVN